jgi:hypothetical protein
VSRFAPRHHHPSPRRPSGLARHVAHRSSKGFDPESPTFESSLYDGRAGFSNAAAVVDKAGSLCRNRFPSGPADIIHPGIRDQSPSAAVLTHRQAAASSAVSAPDRRRLAAPSGRTPSRSHAAARRTHLIQAIRDAARRRKLEAEQLAEDKPARKRAHRAMIALQAAAKHVEQLPDEDPDLAWLQHQHAHHGCLILSQGAVDLLGLFGADKRAWQQGAPSETQTRTLLRRLAAAQATQRRDA